MASNNQQPAVTIRTHRPGDLGYIVHRHGVVYHEEFHYNPKFEGLVARIAADFLDNFDSAKERCWIAERSGIFLGCVMLVKNPECPGTAKLRLLLVEPTARGLGVGRKLLQTCMSFAREAGYQRIVLWTQSNLTAARKLYLAEGFQLKRTDDETTSLTNHSASSQHWELDLTSSNTTETK